MSECTYTITEHDRAILRELGKKARELAEGARNQDIRRRWYAHDEGHCERPLILTETDGGMQMVLPDWQPRCRETWARNLEGMFQSWFMHAEVIGDDFPLEPYVTWQWRVESSNYGVQVQHVRADTPGVRGAFHIEPPLKTLPDDLDLLKPRTFTVDREGTLAWKATLEDVFDGVMGVRQRGNYWWTLGLTIVAIDLIGLEQLMLAMYDAPDALHRLMDFLCGDHLAYLDFLERENLLALNNENDYCGSGSRGYTRRLPRPGHRTSDRVGTQDLWCLLESQETVGVGPELFDEFIFGRQERLARRFGAVYYGCCEPVHTRWHVLTRLPNLRRVSVSPWCDEAFMAEACAARKIAYSRKPNPTLVSTETFDEAAIRRDLRTTMELTRKHGCATEIVMKDVHTLQGHPDRLTRWVALARQVSREVYGA
jgi:hypothetical protein